ncbi:Ig-like domain-containing protein [Streptomyces sp. NPDC058377]|uniref:Ig-like domain-containing protein n=1 Tax=Streptomyces sp. NPDC058377 TaxID=3346468 RepID=UPI00366944BD
MSLWKVRGTFKLATFAALCTVVGVASPAAAAVPSTTVVQASPSTASVSEPVQLTATVTCTDDPTGGLGVTFFDGGDLLDTVPVGPNGQASYTASFTTTGSHTVTAAYNGNDNCNASNDETIVTISATPVPPTTPGGICLLACGGLINFNVGNIHNEVNIH